MAGRMSLAFFQIATALAFQGCHSQPFYATSSSAGHAGPSDDALSEEERGELQSLAQGYSLLYDLFSKESKAGKIFILKSASEATKSIVRNIAESSSTAKKQLEAFDRSDERLRLDAEALPEAEQKTRDAIRSATARELLTAGERFELEMAITQVKATEYATFLARTLARQDKDPQRKAWLEETARTFEELNRLIVNS